jgi:phosphatidylserine/phosphatidylglycerophosphate/cardiolipin synthase-like enzyme
MLLSNVDLAFGSRLALIDGAQRTLDLQYYAIHADSTTEILLEHLRAAARRGVRVRILLDDFNSVGDDAQVLRLAFVRGVEMRLFNPLPGSRGSLFGKLFGSLLEGATIQKRMHNKLFIADNAWGVAGGRNLGDAYFGGDGESAFVDLDVLAAGAVVRQMSASFDRYWNDELAYPVQTLMTREDLERLRNEAGQDQDVAADASRGPSPDKPASQDAAVQTGGRTVLPNAKASDVAAAQRPPLDLRQVPLTWAPATLLVDKPGKVGADDNEVQAGDTVVDGLLNLMGLAKQEVLIISPYFVPGPQMMKVFADMRARGVAIRVLTNSLASNDAPAAHAGYSRYRRDLLGMGIELHEMRADPATAPVGQPPSATPARVGGSSGWMGSGIGGSKGGTSRASLHSKAVIIDRRLAVIGSMNLDLRSQRQNSEVALLIRSAAISEAATRLIETTFARDAYRVETVDGRLQWRAPPGAPFKDTTSEPEAGLRLRLLVDLLGPFAPETML